MNPTLIREMCENDLRSVVNVHLRSFQGFFLSFLGPKFLHELYAAILTDRSGIAYVCEGESMIVGFVVGSDQPRGLYRRLFYRRGWRFAFASLSPALRNPAIIPRLFRAMSRQGGSDIHDDCATILSIAVLPEAQGKGIGKKLLVEFFREAARRNLSQVNLITDRENNDRVNRFYLSMGFTLWSTFVTPEGRQMNEYQIDLGDSFA